MAVQRAVQEGEPVPLSEEEAKDPSIMQEQISSASLEINVEVVDECLRAWMAAGISEEVAKQYSTVKVPVTLGNASGVTVYTDETITDDPDFKIVFITGRNMNGSVVRLLNPNGFCCLHLDAQNINGFVFEKKASAELEILTKQNQNDNGFQIVNLPWVGGWSLLSRWPLRFSSSAFSACPI